MVNVSVPLLSNDITRNIVSFYPKLCKYTYFPHIYVFKKITLKIKYSYFYCKMFMIHNEFVDTILCDLFVLYYDHKIQHQIFMFKPLTYIGKYLENNHISII